MKIVDYAHVAEYGRKDRLFSSTGIRQMNAPIRPTLKAISFRNRVRRCEVVHT
jgi:hypothetical protein